MLRQFARHGVLVAQSKISHNSASEIQYPNIEIGGKGGRGDFLLLYSHRTLTVTRVWGNSLSEIDSLLQHYNQHHSQHLTKLLKNM